MNDQVQPPADLDDPELNQYLDRLLNRNNIKTLICDAFALGATVASIIHSTTTFTLSTPDARVMPTSLVILFPYPVTGNKPVDIIVPDRSIVSQENRSKRSQPN